MTRTAAREIAVRLGFRLSLTGEAPEQAIYSFFDREYYDTLMGEDKLFAEYPDDNSMTYISALVKGTAERGEELDAYIEKYSNYWKLGRISKTALAILRAAVYEILYMEDVPTSSAINEAVELSKRYEEPDTAAFVNGVLGGFVRGELDAAALADVALDDEGGESGDTEPDDLCGENDAISGDNAEGHDGEEDVNG